MSDLLTPQWRERRRLVCWWRGHEKPRRWYDGPSGLLWEYRCSRCGAPWRSYFALALLLAAPLAALEPGVGYVPPPGAQSCVQGGQPPPGAGYTRCYSLDHSARPWGPTGNGLQDVPLFHQRYHGGTVESGWPQGACCELLDAANSAVLREAFDGRCPAVPVARAGRNGAPTTEEIYDLAVTTPRCAGAYRQCWHERKAGGSTELAIPVPDVTRFGSLFRDTCEPGIVTLTGAYCRWPVYYDVQVIPEGWCDEPELPPPPPPPPACDCCPDCPPAPACEALPGFVRRPLTTLLGRDKVGSGVLLRRLQAAARWVLEVECYRPAPPSTPRTELEREP